MYDDSIKKPLSVLVNSICFLCSWGYNIFSKTPNLSCNITAIWVKVNEAYSEIRFLLKVEIIIADLAFAPAPANKRTIHFRLIHTFDATPCNVKKAQKKLPQTFFIRIVPSLPPFGSNNKQLFWGGWLPLGKHLNNVFFFYIYFLQVRVYKELVLQWSFVAIV